MGHPTMKLRNEWGITVESCPPHLFERWGTSPLSGRKGVQVWLFFDFLRKIGR
jgi:hypothetical protein